MGCCGDDTPEKPHLGDCIVCHDPVVHPFKIACSSDCYQVWRSERALAHLCSPRPARTVTVHVPGNNGGVTINMQGRIVHVKDDIEI